MSDRSIRTHHRAPRGAGRPAAFAAAALAAAALALAAAPTAARAQASADAEQLFRDGKKAMKEGRIAEACTAFEASEKAEHNLATVMSLADCREKNQQYATAWALFLQADSQTRADAHGAALNAVAKKRVAALEPRLSYLTINVPDEARIEGLVVTRDDVPVDAGAWNRAMPVDGGDHVVAGRAPGHEPWSTKVTVAAENDKQAVEVPKFKDLPTLVNPPPDADHDHHDQIGPAVIVAPEASPWTLRREIAAGVAAGAVVAAGVGVGFGIDARGLRSDALATCPPSACTQANAAAANTLEDRARSRGVIADVGFALAGGAAITAAVLWFTGAPEEAPDDKVALRVVPTVGDAAGFALAGSF